MTPDEVIEKLKTLGIEVSRPTLSRYEKQRLIPSPERGSLGRAGGRWTNYPERTVEEAYVAWKLMHGDYGDESIIEIFGGKMPLLNPVTLATIRDIYYYKNDKDFKLKKRFNIVEAFNLDLPESMMKIKPEARRFLECFEEIWRNEIEKVKERMSE